MAKRRRILPFWAWPANWGLEGKRKQLAQAEYYFDGEELEQKVDEINGVSELDRDLRQLKRDLRYKRITEHEYEKQVATLKGEPFCKVKDSKFDFRRGVTSFMQELDWNEAFIEYLQKNGYTGLSDEVIVERWFNDLVRDTYPEGEPEEVEESLPLARPQWSTQIRRRDDDKTEYY